ALAFEHRLSARGAADLERSRVQIEARTDVSDEIVELRRLEIERRHACCRYAGGDGPADVVIGRCAAKLLARQVHAGNGVAIPAMTEGALARIEFVSALNLCGAELPVLRLRHGPLWRCQRECGANEKPRCETLCHFNRRGLPERVPARRRSAGDRAACP